MHPPITKEWSEVLDSLVHVSNMAAMELRLPRQEGADSLSLWERDAITVRFLLEEGKINLLLRLVQAYKQALAERGIHLREVDRDEEHANVPWLSLKADELDLRGDLSRLISRLFLFEASVGVLLQCSLAHVEVVQTTDMALLFGYCAEVLLLILETPLEFVSFERTQELSVLLYLQLVFTHSETLGEGRMVPFVQRHGILSLVVAVLHRHHALLPEEGKLAACTFLAAVFDSEDFGVCKGDFLTSEAKAQLSEFKPRFLGSITQDAAMRRQLRPLLDVVTQVGG